jgi:hypothetical protein
MGAAGSLKRPYSLSRTNGVIFHKNAINRREEGNVTAKQNKTS